jgi:hypothetical protein
MWGKSKADPSPGRGLGMTDRKAEVRREVLRRGPSAPDLCPGSSLRFLARDGPLWSDGRLFKRRKLILLVTLRRKNSILSSSYQVFCVVILWYSNAWIRIRIVEAFESVSGGTF